MMLAAFVLLSAQDLTPYPIGTPPPHAETAHPGRSRIEATYECYGRSLSITVVDDGDRVRVEHYEGSVRAANATDLAVWNDWLSPLTSVGHVEMHCNPEGVEFIHIHGGVGGRRLRDIRVFWSRGRLGPLVGPEG